MNAIVCTKHTSGLIKETWQTTSDTAALTETEKPFRIISGDEEKAFLQLEKEIESNHCLPRGLRIISKEDYSYRYQNSVSVYRYPIFDRTYKPSYDQPRAEYHKSLREKAKQFCLKTNGPIILTPGDECLGYKVSSKRVAVDGDFVLTYQEKHIVMSYEPAKAKRIKKNPARLEDPVHRTGHFRIGELIGFISIFEWEIRNVPIFDKVVHWITFPGLCAPKEIDAAKKVLKLAKAVVHVCRGYTYRESEDFYDFLKKAKVVLKATRQRKIKVKSSAQKAFYAFLRHEIRLAVRRGKMV